MASTNVLSTIGSGNVAGNLSVNAGSGDGKPGQAGAEFAATMAELLAGLGGQNSEADPVAGGDHRPGGKNRMEEDPLMAALLTMFGSLLMGADMAGTGIRSDFPAGKEANSGKVNGDAELIEPLLMSNLSFKGWNMKLGTGDSRLSAADAGAQRAGMQPLGQGENPTLTSELDKDRVQDLLTALSGQIKMKTGITPEVQQIFDRTFAVLSGLDLVPNLDQNLDPNVDSKARIMNSGFQEGSDPGSLKGTSDSGLGQEREIGPGQAIRMDQEAGTEQKARSALGLAGESANDQKATNDSQPVEAAGAKSESKANGQPAKPSQIPAKQELEHASPVAQRNAFFHSGVAQAREATALAEGNLAKAVFEKELPLSGRAGDLPVGPFNQGMLKGIGIEDPETALAAIQADSLTVRSESKASGLHALSTGTGATEGVRGTQAVSHQESETPSKGFSQEGQGQNPGTGFGPNSPMNGISSDRGVPVKNEIVSVWQQIANSLNEHVLLRKEGSLRRPQVQELEIQLHPAELGKIQIALRWDDGTVHLQVQASDRGTGTLLQNHLSDLRQSLQDAGVSCGAMQMDFGGERGQRSYQEMVQSLPKRLTEKDIPVSPYAEGIAPLQRWDTPGPDGYRINITA